MLAKQIDKEQVQMLVQGRLTAGDAANLLRQTSEENLTAEIIDLFVQTIKTNMVPEAAQLIEQLKTAEQLFDCSGTGGSGLPHFNTSTTVAFILSAADVPVAKFGNRAAGSLSGSFDFLDGLGVGKPLTMPQMIELFRKTYLIFLYAPQFYPTLGKLAPIRKELRMRTVLNLIGPLLNPLCPPYRMLGTPQLTANKMIADHLARQAHLNRAAVVSSEQGLDEMELSTNHMHMIESAKVTYILHSFHSSHFTDHSQAPRAPISVDESVRIFFSLINSELPDDNYFQRVVCLNAGTALAIAGKAAGIEDGYEQAAKMIKDKIVKEKFEDYRRSYAAILG
jgi:anthranilate phosphoribosyltransferase